MANSPRNPHSFTITVDGESLDVQEHELTPAQIMERAGIDVETHYLVEVDGQHQVSYQGKNDVPIRIHERQKLISLSTGPTTVS